MRNQVEHTAILLLKAGKFELEFTSPALLRSVIEKNFSHQETVVVQISRMEGKRSVKQNRYYWGVIVPYVREFLYETQGRSVTPDEVHAYHTSIVIGLKPELRTMNGEEFFVMKSVKTSDMTIKQFNEFVLQLQTYWAERGLVIPDPTEDVSKEYFSENLKQYLDE